MKKLIWGGGIAALLVLTLVGLGRWWVWSITRPQALEALLEKNLTCEARVASSKTGLWLDQIEIQGLKLFHRGEAGGEPEIAMDQANLDVHWWPLLRGEFRIREFTLREPSVKLTLYQAGGNSLERLLTKPEKNEPQADQSPEQPTKKPTPEVAQHSGKPPKRERGALNVFDFQFLAKLDEVSVEDGQFDLVLEKTGLRILVDDFRAQLQDFTVRPQNLEEINSVDLQSSGWVELFSGKQLDRRYVKLGLQGPAQLRLFDPQTGDLSLGVQADWDVDPDSYLDARIPVVEKAWSLLGELERIGFRPGSLPNRLAVISQRLKGSYLDEKVHLNEPFRLEISGVQVALLEESWIDTQRDVHEFHAEFAIGPEAVGWVGQQVEERLGKLVGSVNELTPLVAQGLSSLGGSDGRLALRVSTSGALSKPSVHLDQDLDSLIPRDLVENLSGLKERQGEIKDELKSLGKEILREELEEGARLSEEIGKEATGLLRGLLGDDEE